MAGTGDSDGAGRTAERVGGLRSPISLGAGANPFNGTAGPNLNGNWTLRIQDTVAGNSGVLLHWSLSLELTKPASTSGELCERYPELETVSHFC